MKKYDFDDLYEGPRLELKAKKRKTRRLLGLLIFTFFLVTFLIISKFNSQSQIAEEVNSDQTNMEEVVKDERDEEQDTEVSSPAIDDNQEIDIGEETEQELGGNTEIKPGNVNDKESERVGTSSQEGTHVTSYEEGSKDWNGMVQAIEVATNLSEENMIIWWLGNGGGPGLSDATVTSKDQKEIYQVKLEKVEGNGWSAISVQQLEENKYNSKEEDSL